jgi:hypothetical protein
MVTVDLREWREILTPCLMMPDPVASYVFFMNSLSDAKARIIEVLGKYGIPYVTFPDDDNIVVCRMRFVLEPRSS